MFIHKTSGVSLTALIDTFGRFSWYDMMWHLLQLTWEIRLCDQKGILLCCRGTGEHSVIRPLWWTNSEIRLKNKFQHKQTPSKHSMNIFLRYFPVYFTRQKTTWTFLMFFVSNLWFQIHILLSFNISFQVYRNFFETKSFISLCSLRTIPCRCNGVASNLFYRQMHITCIIIK